MDEDKDINKSTSLLDELVKHSTCDPDEDIDACILKLEYAEKEIDEYLKSLDLKEK